MKNIIFGFTVFIFGAASVNASTSAEFVKFVSVKSHQVLSDSTFPRIEVTYSLDCSQQFLKVLREELSASPAGKAYINLGVLVVENSALDCSGKEDVTADAGHAYSGRDYEITYIAK